MAGAERPVLVGTQIKTLSLLEETDRQIEKSGESYCVQIVGLSGIGKSTIVQELAQNLSGLTIDPEAERFDFANGDSSLTVELRTLTGELFDENGKIALEHGVEETLRVSQRTLSTEEAQTMFTGLEYKSRESLDLIDSYTLGVPKLIKIVAERDLPIHRILELSGNYLASHLQGLPDSAVHVALQTIEKHFLAEGRVIPDEIKDHVIASRYKSSALGEAMLHLSAQASNPHFDRRESAQFILDAVKNMHPASLAFYKEKLGSEGHGKTYELEAWLECPEIEMLDRWKLMSDELHTDEYGTLGKFMEFFNLQRNMAGFVGKSGFGFAGEYNKSKFLFRIGDEDDGVQIGNTSDKEKLELVGGNTRDFYVSDELYQRRWTRTRQFNSKLPNYYIEAWDHYEFAQASQMLMQEAALQALGVRYKVQRSDKKTYEYIPGEKPTFIEIEREKAWGRKFGEDR